MNDSAEAYKVSEFTNEFGEMFELFRDGKKGYYVTGSEIPAPSGRMYIFPNVSGVFFSWSEIAWLATVIENDVERRRPREAVALTERGM